MATATNCVIKFFPGYRDTVFFEIFTYSDLPPNA